MLESRQYRTVIFKSRGKKWTLDCTMFLPEEIFWKGGGTQGKSCWVEEKVQSSRTLRQLKVQNTREEAAK